MFKVKKVHFAGAWLGVDLELKELFMLKKAKFTRSGLEQRKKESFKVKKPVISLNLD